MTTANDIVDLGDAGRLVAEAATEDFPTLLLIAELDPVHDLRFANCSGIDFSSADLRGYDFTGARLEGCSFDGALIEGAPLTCRNGGLGKCKLQR